LRKLQVVELSHFWEMRVHIVYRVNHLSCYLLPQFLSEEPLILLNVSMNIEDVHVPRIFIFIVIWENFRFLRNESTYSIYRVHHLSGYLLPQFSSVIPVILPCGRLNLLLLRPSPVLPKIIKISRLFKISEFFFFFTKNIKNIRNCLDLIDE
jgi:hypothetical protein